jgi:protein-tyrosine phosphatase
MKILVICLGNICRSPMAEGLLVKHLNEKSKYAVWSVDSCGTSNYHKGELADHRMRLTANKYGIELTHRSRQLKIEDFDLFDHLMVMDEQNYKDVIAVCPEKKDKVNLLSNYSSNYKGQMIPDPYFGDLKGFDEVYKLLDHICAEIVQGFNLKY